MIQKIGDGAPPRGLRLRLYRLPIVLYRLRLGRLLGGRFLLLRHTGRRTGRARQTVLEVVRHDTEARTWYVASGWGERSDWFRNVLARPEAEIEVSGRRWGVQARRLPIEDAEHELADYARRHPAAARMVARLAGYRIDGLPKDIEALARIIPMMAFQRRSA